MRLLRDWLLAVCLLPVVLAGRPKKDDRAFELPYRSLFYFEDSAVILALDSAGDVLRSEDDGKGWEKVGDVSEAIEMIAHPFDAEKAVILSADKKHWSTNNRGKTWKKFEVNLPVSYHQLPPLSFNAKNTNYALYAGRNCDESQCTDTTYYTKDWFDSDPKLLTKDTHSCLFARGSKLFSEASDSTVFCIVDGDDKYTEHRKLLTSEDFFANSAEPKLDGYNTVKGVVAMVSVTKFLVAAVRSSGTDEMALYVSDDAKTWDRAEFPQGHGRLREDAYTILESTPYSIQVDVLSSMGGPIGSLFTSNSNGTYFTHNLDHTNRIREGLVDFEQIEGIDGIVLANVVENAEEVKGNPNAKKRIQSKISFDDGRMGSWKPLKIEAVGGGNKELHLHSVTELLNGGRVYSSRAPGLVMGVGNIGDTLGDYTDGDLYISNNAGLTWSKTREGAHKYEFGASGSIIVAVNDEDTTNKVFYSKDFGEHWDDFVLGIEFRARLLTTTPDATSLKFLLVGAGKDKQTHIFRLDFSDVFDGPCKMDTESESKSDFEKWYARYDDDKKPDCLMGHKQFFWRRKKDSICNAGNLYKEPKAEEEHCKCQEQDYECDFNFVRDSNQKCVLAPGAKLPIPPEDCKTPQDTYMGPSGYRKIPGNSCKGGVSKGEILRNCGEAISTPSTGKIVAISKEFQAGMPLQYFYLDNAESASIQEETIFMMTDRQELWVSHDHGKQWEHILKDVTVIDVYPPQNHFDYVYFVTNTEDLYYTNDRGRNFKKLKVPVLPNKRRLPYLEFHPTKKDWFIWHGQKDCVDLLRCHTAAYYTTSGGVEWHALKSYSGACKWFRGKQTSTSDKLIFCEHEAKEGDVSPDSMELLSSVNFFVDEKKHFDRIKGFTTVEEFVVVAGVKDDDSLKAFASVDGQTFADAHFPHGFDVPHQTAYTVLDSVTHSVFIHVTVNALDGFEYGSLLKSNSNGTNYVLSLGAVNRNGDGYVDYEKMKIPEGIAIANRVDNPEAAREGKKKLLRSLITHNDGGEWKYITPPKTDSESKPYKCSGTLDECSLNLHHFTERRDPRHTFSSGSAVGFMMGIGNVGDALKGPEDGDTFLTTDGGFNWKEVRKGQYLWEYGDQGSIIVIVDRAQPTDKVLYTLDEGSTWQEYKFGDKMRVTDITTVPSDNSRRFLLWGKKEGGREKFFTVHLDFSGITSQKCLLKDEDDGDNGDDDFLLWSPNVEAEDQCLFGHIAQYYRKIPSHRCYIGRNLNRQLKAPKNCTCVSQDYECDFNYERASDNTCKLVTGLPPPDHKAACEDASVMEYSKPTGYRRLPMTTCFGGKELDKGASYPCPGKEEQYKKKHKRITGFGLFLVIVCPIVAAVGIGYYIWTRMLSGRFGAIRLGEDVESPFIQYPIIAISAVVAVAAAIPSILSALGGWVSRRFTRTRRYTTRSSFARGDYSIVNTDEGELLGSDDEDEA